MFIKNSIKISLVLSVISMVGLFFNQTTAQPSKEDIQKSGQDIINSSQLNIYKGSDTKNIISVFLEIDARKMEESKRFLSQNNIREKQALTYITSNISIDGTDRVRIYTSEKEESKIDKRRSTTIINGNDIYSYKEIFSEGVFIEESKYFAMAGFANLIPQVKPNKSNYLKEIWSNVFPLFLKDFWTNEIEFIYLGKAESQDTRANIIQIKLPDSDIDRKIFIDQRTNLLLMMTEEKANERFKYSTKYYFSDFKVASGLLIPHLIKIETLENYFDKDSVLLKETKIIQELVVKDFKINPKFNAKEFEIKDKTQNKDK